MKILGVKVDNLTLRQAQGKALKAVEKEHLQGSSLKVKPYFIVTPNPEQVVLAQDDAEFKRVLNSADIAIADGVGLVWASRLLTRPGLVKQQGLALVERVGGVELMESLIEEAGKRKWKVMLVGGRGDIAVEAAEVLRRTVLKRTDLVDKQQGPSLLEIRGVEGLRDVKNPDKNEEKQLIKQINEYKPQLLFVGFGAPWQEKWVAKHLQGRTLKVGVVMVVGGAFDQIAKPSMRPWKWMERVGLGWFYRLLRQPWRLKRQLKLLRFVKLVLKG